MISSKPKAVFVGGPNRSGTTWMRQLLSSHSEISMPPTESHFFDMVEKAGKNEGALSFERFSEWVREYEKLTHWGIEESALLEAGRKWLLEEPDVAGLFDELIGLYASAHGKSIKGEKSTFLERHFSTLQKFYGDEFRFIQVIRNPVDTFNSHNFYKGIPQDISPFSWSRKWSNSIYIGLHLSANFPKQYKMVRYEDMFEDPSAVLREVCQFINVDDQADSMLEMRQYRRKSNSSFSNASAGGLDEGLSVIIRKECALPAYAVGYDLGLMGHCVNDPVLGRPENMLGHLGRFFAYLGNTSLQKRGLRKRFSTLPKR